MNYLDWGLNILMIYLWIRCCRKCAAAGCDYSARRANRFRWFFTWFVILFFLFFRACIYFYVGTTSGWQGRLNLGIIEVPFASFDFSSMVLFSFVSLFKWMVLLYSWVLFFSAFSAGAGDGLRNWASDLQAVLLKNVGTQWFSVLKIVFPGFLMPVIWGVFCFIADCVGIITWGSSLQVLKEGIMLTLALYYSYSYFLVFLSIIYFFITYFYLRGSVLQNYLRDVIRKIFTPLYYLPLTTPDGEGGVKIDFVPVVGLAISFLIVERGDELLMFLCGYFL